ncbi:hypothetical protein CKM354_000991400 [Cercospora kikuchii]|uniref:Zn(2)-C6 fungal-type domain-containing protein n=1 Tax=Cercospora kikuchii TaxID=84275 RepID=A0A9P3CPY5_9PEZI|nr:uncharacterized protein CKM354_000991400 [Cercospora kikuchii]GIZ46804.1 hypothetical protein CKM354_000991400 [Cercospora kikuchii]
MKRTVKSSKSRGGCQRCKSKHIKCDETKPACQICIAQGAECPGYTKQLRWSSKHEILTGPPQKRQRTSQDTSLSPTNSNVAEGDVARPPTSDASERASYQAPVATALGFNDDSALDMYGWPDMEQYGLEDLTFSTLFPGPSPEEAQDASFDTQPFLGGIYGGLSQLIPNGAEPISGGNMTASGDDAIKDDAIAKQLPTPPPKADSSRPASLLKTFYRLAVPNKVPGFSEDDLVSHYFNHVCAIYSCFDSEANQFRTLVAEHCATSSTVRFTIESMAIGHLANFYPHIAVLGNAKRGRAWKSLQQDLQLLRNGKSSIDTVLLSLLLLGVSSSWHQASNLGLQYLFIARDLVQVKLQRNEHSPHDEFLLDAIMYWEMLASFIDPVPMAALQGLKSPDLAMPVRQAPITPHPWTGISSEIFFVLAEVGRILRRRVRNGVLGTGDEEWATHLEKLLYTWSPPEASSINDPGDKRTPLADLILISQAYRLVGLLEIYRAFPNIFWQRTKTSSIFDLLPEPSSEDTKSSHINSDSTKSYKSPLDYHLTMLATQTLDLVKPIPISSGACRLLPLIMLIAGSQLRLPDNITHSHNTTTTSRSAAEVGSSDHADPDTTQQYDDLVAARYLVEQRMLVLSRKYAQRPQLCALDIVKEVWERADNPGTANGNAGGGGGAHWIDVAHEKCWQTIFG